ncbi:GlxA family transcriptional regulator [Pacificoceanicola onchidii]|uniref:GlxA family transcriptional regulator n=1 Tax=Pacificoceanicola onchidii TaxID=2562685 RepID=UPI0010A3116E|nr:GlxA family transcriptional regulator [Pacificoceanicola onchidii]
MTTKTTTPNAPNEALIPAGAFRYPLDGVPQTRWFGFLLVPDFTLLAFSSALDPLRIANQLSQKPLYGWRVLSSDGGPVQSSSGIEIGAQGDLSCISSDLHLLVCSGNNGIQMAPENLVAAVRKHARFGGRVGGICSGAGTLARAGLLNGKRFTLHWENQPGFLEAFPDLSPSRARFEVDGNLVTCSGGSAATEMMVRMIAEDHGEDFAIAVADMCLNTADSAPDREQRSSIARAIDSRNPKLLHVLRAMYANVEEPLPLDTLAENAGLSRRHMERLFTSVLGEAPASTYRNIKLDKARALFAETDMSVTDVAVATGFTSAGVLSRHFKARFGETPYGKRKA